MIPFPQIQIHQQYARIGIQSQPGQYDIKHGYADLNIDSNPATVSIHQELPELQIDSSRMWEALNGGNGQTFVNRIYSQMPQIMQQNIMHMVEKGNRMANLENHENPIPDIVYEEAFGELPHLQIFGPASPDNVDIRITPHKPDIQIDRGELKIDVQTHKPEIEYNRGKVNIYMQQYASVTITPPVLDNRI
jgi:hypothetical protein